MRFHAFGSCVESDLLLPGVRAARGTPNADCWLFDARSEAGLRVLRDHPRVATAMARGAPINTCNISTFQTRAACFGVIAGCHLLAYPANDDVHDLALFALGRAFCVALGQRGLLSLHGAAFEIEGRAVAVVGHRGAGKSTFAAAAVAKGLRIVADDLLAIDVDRQLAFPGPGFVKTWPRTLEAFGLPSAEKLERVHPDFEKRFLPVCAPSRPLPLAAVLVLARGHEQLCPLTGAAAVAQLTSNTHSVDQEGSNVASTLRRAAALVRAIPVMLLQVPHDLRRVPSALDLVCRFARDLP